MLSPGVIIRDKHDTRPLTPVNGEDKDLLWLTGLYLPTRKNNL